MIWFIIFLKLYVYLNVFDFICNFNLIVCVFMYSVYIIFLGWGILIVNINNSMLICLI